MVVIASTTLGDERARASALQLLHELADAGDPGLARQRQQPAFNQILLVCGQIEPGMIPQELTQIIILGRGHG
ncbi:hypothetical protein ACVWZ6_000639 [Bradyrhizobium sp. GM6.1]